MKLLILLSVVCIATAASLEFEDKVCQYQQQKYILSSLKVTFNCILIHLFLLFIYFSYNLLAFWNHSCTHLQCIVLGENRI